MSDMEKWINEPDENFHPAKAGDSPIWLGSVKYVRADRIEELGAKLAKAVDFIEDLLSGRDRDDDWRIEANAILVELKGQNDE